MLRPSGLFQSRRLRHALRSHTEAAAYGHTHVVEFLANAGANLGVVDLIGACVRDAATPPARDQVPAGGGAGQPLEERPRFNAAVTGEFDASPIRLVSE